MTTLSRAANRGHAGQLWVSSVTDVILAFFGEDALELAHGRSTVELWVGRDFLQRLGFVRFRAVSAVCMRR